MNALKCQCGLPATGTIEVPRNPDHAERMVASVHGYLTAADFKRVPACDDCRRKDGTL